MLIKVIVKMWIDVELYDIENTQVGVLNFFPFVALLKSFQKSSVRKCTTMPAKITRNSDQLHYFMIFSIINRNSTTSSPENERGSLGNLQTIHARKDFSNLPQRITATQDYCT